MKLTPGTSSVFVSESSLHIDDVSPILAQLLFAKLSQHWCHAVKLWDDAEVRCLATRISMTSNVGTDCSCFADCWVRASGATFIVMTITVIFISICSDIFLFYLTLNNPSTLPLIMSVGSWPSGVDVEYFSFRIILYRWLGQRVATADRLSVTNVVYHK